MQRAGYGACFPRMPHVIDSVIFAGIMLFVLVFGRTEAAPARDLNLWSDETERRMLAGGRHDWP